MGQLQRYRCCECGHEEWAPNNRTGRYALMSGTVQMFLCRTHHNIARILISTSYFFDDDVDDSEANKLIAEVVERGDVDYSPAFPVQPIPGKGTVRHTLEPWNAITGKCPKCGGQMEQDGSMCMMVD